MQKISQNFLNSKLKSLLMTNEIPSCAGKHRKISNWELAKWAKWSFFYRQTSSILPGSSLCETTWCVQLPSSCLASFTNMQSQWHSLVISLVRAISILFGINGVRKQRSHLVGPPFSEFKARFSATVGWHFLRDLTRRLLIGGCGQSHISAKHGCYYLWEQFWA